IIGRKVKGRVNYFYLVFFGFVIFFSGWSSFVDHLPFPPFGIIGIVSNTISTFILIIGFFGIIKIMNSDHKLKLQLREYVEKNYTFLESISEAELISKTMNLISEIDKKHDRGREIGHIEFDVKEYMNELIKEVKDLRKEDV